MKNIFKFFILTAKTAPSFIAILLFSSLSKASLVIFNSFTPMILLNAIQTKELDTIIKSILFIAIINLIIALLISITNNVLESSQAKTNFKLYNVINKKISKLEYKCLENPYYLDLKERAIFAFQNQNIPYLMMYTFSTVITSIITIVTSIIILLNLGVIIFLIILIVLVLNIVIQFSNNKITKKFYDDIIPNNRVFNYYLDVTLNKKYAKDIRLFNNTDFFINKLDNFTSEIQTTVNDWYMNSAKISIFKQMLLGLSSFGIYLFVSYKTIVNKLGISTYSLYLSTSISLVSSVNDLSKSLIDCALLSKVADPFFELLNIEETASNSKLKLEEVNSIEFDDVSFKYPNTDNYILKNISFKINKGEQISIVGLNGAGKTTLVKLLCKFYEPTTGNILINDININEYNTDLFNEEVATVFQDFNIFNYSIKDNVCNFDYNKEKFEDVISKVGLTEFINSLPKKEETNLGKDYDKDATELSGGQLQKLSIARALYKDSSLIILDEPTASLDPIAEAQVFEDFNKLVNNKTALYISHRMSSSVFCDKVLVINNNKIEDFDTHNNLMKKDSLYKELFNKQKDNYN